LGEFAYFVSHDLGAAFRHVGAFSRLLLAELGDDLTGRQQAFAQRIDAARAHGEAMIEQLTIYSRIEQGPLNLQPCDAAELARPILAEIASHYGPGRFAVSLEPLGAVEADEGWLTEALRRLLDNAAKFSASAADPRIVITDASVAGAWRLRVSDNGPGVAPDQRERAFQMFQRLSGEAFPGVGAGLAICRRIARRHGGELRFIDARQGACLELELPRAGRAARRPARRTQ
jgi:signal transduction histidine kinase